jgi:hypothetical protein
MTDQPAIAVQRPRLWKRLLWQVPVAVLSEKEKATHLFS